MNTATQKNEKHPAAWSQQFVPSGDVPNLDALVEKIRNIVTSGSPRAIRISGVSELTGISRSQIFNQLDPDSPAYDADFPMPFRLGKSSNSPSVWWEHEVVAWMQRKSQSRISSDSKLN